MLTLNHNYFNILPSNKCKDTGQPASKRRYVLGLFLLLLVNILWVTSAELTKYIYTELKLERPFLISYLQCSLLIVYLIVLCFTPPTKDPSQPEDYTQLLEPSSEAEEDNYYNEANNSLGDSTFVPVRAGETTDSDDAAPRAVRFNKVAEVRVMSASLAGQALLARLSWAASARATAAAQRRAAAAATRRHLRLAVAFSLPWFISHYLFRVSLLHTSAGAATIYLSTSSALTLALGSLCAQAPPDRFNLVKAAAILLTTAGLVIIGLASSKNEWVAILSALGAAFSYAIHLVGIRRELRKPDGINAPLLAGLVGACCLCGAWALGAALSALGGERILPSSPSEPPLAPLSALAPRAVALLLFNAVLAPLLMEAVWLWASSLTSPQVATGSLFLAAPLPVLADTWRGDTGLAHAVAATLVALGWLLASTDTNGASNAANWIKMKLHARQGFSTLRNVPELDEQSEALMSSEEPT